MTGALLAASPRARSNAGRLRTWLPLRIQLVVSRRRTLPPCRTTRRDQVPPLRLLFASRVQPLPVSMARNQTPARRPEGVGRADAGWFDTAAKYAAGSPRVGFGEGAEILNRPALGSGPVSGSCTTPASAPLPCVNRRLAGGTTRNTPAGCIAGAIRKTRRASSGRVDPMARTGFDTGNQRKDA